MTDSLYSINTNLDSGKNHSTHMALSSLIDRLTNAVEDGEYVIGIFLDFPKAFDTVDHEILLEKLYQYGIRGCAHNWLTSYLSNRKQFVTYNGTQSEKQTIKCGVPRLDFGLFIVYINDLPHIYVIIHSMCCLQMIPISLLVVKILII